MDIDPDVAQELMASFEDHYETVQYSLNKLGHNTNDIALINTIFRSVHTVKGNAAMAQIQPLVDYTHAIEESISSMRAAYFAPTATLCDLLLTSVDRLKDLHDVYLFNKKSSNIPEQAIINVFNAISSARSADEVEQYSQQLTAIFYPEEGSAPTSITANSSSIQLATIADHRNYLTITDAQSEDLLLFRILALQVDEQNPFWHKRTDQLLYLSLKMTELSDRKIDDVQLVAAIYMHDVTMAFVSETIVNKNTKLNSLEGKKIHQHPVWGYNLLMRMPPWRPAARVVLEHHERVDGNGYPHGTLGAKLTDEAKIIAILDAYYAMTNLRADRSHRRSILRAVSEVNACIDTQFDRYWVEIFNQVVRQEVKTGNL